MQNELTVKPFLTEQQKSIMHEAETALDQVVQGGRYNAHEVIMELIQRYAQATAQCDWVSSSSKDLTENRLALASKYRALEAVSAKVKEYVDFADEYVEAWKDGMAGDSYMFDKAIKLVTEQGVKDE